MDNVLTEYERYAQAALLHSYLLKSFYLVQSLDVKHSAQLAIGGQLAHLALNGSARVDITSGQ